MKPHTTDDTPAHTITFQPGDALLLVDPQRDFTPGGAVPVPDGDRVIARLNELIALAQSAAVPILASRDTHPPDHSSFDAQGGPWPAHCVYNTPGCEFDPKLDIPLDAHVIDKGGAQDHDNYSAFDETGLAARLRQLGVSRVVIAGLALDVCVKHTCADAVNEGFHTVLITDATAPADPEQRGSTIAELKSVGVDIATHQPVTA